MAKNKSNDSNSGFEAIESSLSRTEQFIEKNQTKIIIAVVAVLAIVGLYMAYQKLYKAPLNQKASEQIYVAEQYFKKDSFDLALNGDGNYPGFLQIIENYGSTGAGNMSYYYAGISYMKLKNWDKAIKYLGDFSSGDMYLNSMAKGNIGDAYAEKGDDKSAAKYYQKAVDANNNKFTVPIYLMKLGRTYERLKDNANALKAYKTIKEKYFRSREARSIDKFIKRVEK